MLTLGLICEPLWTINTKSFTFIKHTQYFMKLVFLKIKNLVLDYDFKQWCYTWRISGNTCLISVHMQRSTPGCWGLSCECRSLEESPLHGPTTSRKQPIKIQHEIHRWLASFSNCVKILLIISDAKGWRKKSMWMESISDSFMSSFIMIMTKESCSFTFKCF